MLLLRKFTFWLALLGIVSSGLFVLRLRAGLNEPVPPPPIKPASKPFEHALGAAGLVEATRENTLIGVPVPGLIASLEVKVWDKVEVGQPLLHLDDRELQAALGPQRAQVRVAEAALARLREQLARLERVSDARAISAEDLRLRKSDVAVAEAQLEAARASETQTRALLERLTVRSPIAATILQVNTRVGEFATPGSPTPLLVLGATDSLQVRADIDEQLAPRVQKGARAVAFVKGDSSNPIAMEFVRVEPVIIPKKSLTGASLERVDTRVLQVIFRFINPAERPVYVGQQMDVFIEETR